MRVTELGVAAFENFDANRLAAAILLTRAAVETTAALWYLCNKITSALKEGTSGTSMIYLEASGGGQRNGVGRLHVRNNEGVSLSRPTLVIA